MVYNFIRSILFLFDPEKVHHFSMNVLHKLCNISFFQKLIKKQYGSQNSTPINLLGLTFKNSVGLAAGFDKNAKYLRELETLGFGFVEIGTVTPIAQDGNETPRLFRLPKDKALINRMGFNNDGVDVVLERLRRWQLADGRWQGAVGRWQLADGSLQPANKTTDYNKQLQTANCKLIIGGNIGKNKITPNEDAWKDYEICFNKLHPFVDYFVVNVSSPNTPGLRELQEKESLRKILTNLQTQNLNFENKKPILLKIAPDLTQTQIDDVVQLALEIKLDGLVVANTSLDKSKLITDKSTVEKIGLGGLSGLPLKARATDMVCYIAQKTNNSIPIIASGGIFTGADAQEKITAGASLVQVWTGFVYEGPAIVKNILNYLAKHKTD